MMVHFYQPPVRKIVGGLDRAITNLREFLVQSGIRVHTNSALPRVSRQSPPTIVHFHALWEPIHSWLSWRCRRRGIPYIVSPHGMLEPWAWQHKNWKKRPYYQLLEKYHLIGARALLASGQLEADHLQSFFPGARIEAIPLGLSGEAKPNYFPARSKLGWTNDETVLLFLSRIHKKKGLDLLLQALVLMGSDIPAGVRLVIVGDGAPNYVNRLRDYVRDQRSALPRIEWVGEVWSQHKWHYFQGADLFCLPTHSENFGLAIGEACQVGTPVLSTPNTPWGQWLPEQGCFIVDLNLDHLQMALRKFFRQGKWSEQRRKQLSEWTWGNFNWQMIGPRYLRLYERLHLDG